MMNHLIKILRCLPIQLLLSVVVKELNVLKLFYIGLYTPCERFFLSPLKEIKTNGARNSYIAE